MRKGSIKDKFNAAFGHNKVSNRLKQAVKECMRNLT